MPGDSMDRTLIINALSFEPKGQNILLKGWVKTRRDSKGGFSFIELNDGSCMSNIQIIADNS
jgi:asparaginyl-tRNA synthetase